MQNKNLKRIIEIKRTIASDPNNELEQELITRYSFLKTDVQSQSISLTPKIKEVLSFLISYVEGFECVCDVIDYKNCEPIKEHYNYFVVAKKEQLPQQASMDKVTLGFNTKEILYSECLTIGGTISEDIIQIFPYLREFMDIISTKQLENSAIPLTDQQVTESLFEFFNLNNEKSYIEYLQNPQPLRTQIYLRYEKDYINIIASKDSQPVYAYCFPQYPLDFSEVKQIIQSCTDVLKEQGTYAVALNYMGNNENLHEAIQTIGDAFSRIDIYNTPKKGHTIQPKQGPNN